MKRSRDLYNQVGVVGLTGMAMRPDLYAPGNRYQLAHWQFLVLVEEVGAPDDIIKAALEFIQWPAYQDPLTKETFIAPPPEPRLRDWIIEYDRGVNGEGEPIRVPDKIRERFLKRLNNSDLWKLRQNMRKSLAASEKQIKKMEDGEVPVGGVVSINYLSEAAGRAVMSINTLKDTKAPTINFNDNQFLLDAGPPPAPKIAMPKKTYNVFSEKSQLRKKRERAKLIEGEFKEVE